MYIFTHWYSALVMSTENLKTLRFRKFISEIQFINHFPKIYPSENFPLYGIFTVAMAINSKQIKA